MTGRTDQLMRKKGEKKHFLIDWRTDVHFYVVARWPYIILYIIFYIRTPNVLSQKNVSRR